MMQTHVSRRSEDLRKPARIRLGLRILPLLRKFTGLSGGFSGMAFGTCCRDGVIEHAAHSRGRDGPTVRAAILVQLSRSFRSSAGRGRRAERNPDTHGEPPFGHGDHLVRGAGHIAFLIRSHRGCHARLILSRRFGLRLGNTCAARAATGFGVLFG